MPGFNETSMKPDDWQSIQSLLSQKRVRITKKHYDELSEDQRLIDLKEWYRISVFYSIVYTIAFNLTIASMVWSQ